MLPNGVENPENATMQRDEAWMREALLAAVEAQGNGEVPVGACLVSSEGVLLARAGNRTLADSDPTAHAEILVLREAAQRTANHRISGAVMYSTIEPCAMCAGALVQARIKRLVYGAPDERAGAVISNFRICNSSSLNHRIEITSGVLEAECRAIVQEFFRKRREKQGERRRAKGESSDMP
jgi:tRNA(adenine34) deaminase